jgi:hypothetical protein
MRIAFALAAALSLLACGRSETDAPPPASTPPVSAPAPEAQAPAPARVSAIDLGTAIGPDKRVTAPAATFAPDDTIYASISTESSAPSLTLTARWTYQDGQLVNESTETIAARGPATTEFHIAQPDGLPPGRYTLVVTADGTPAGTRDFEVR